MNSRPNTSLLAIAALPVLLLSACFTPKYKPAPVTPQALTCDGDKPAHVTLYSPADAKLAFEGKSYVLNRIETASGAHYGNSEITFWNKGGIDATITRKNGATSHCTLTPRSGL